MLLMQATLAMGMIEGVLFLRNPAGFLNPGPLRTCILMLLPQEINIFIGDHRVVQLPRPVFRMNTDRSL